MARAQRIPLNRGRAAGSNSEPTRLGLEAAQGQYMALVRAKISKVNERIMPREWIKDVLRDKVSADFSLIIKRDGQIQSSRLCFAHLVIQCLTVTPDRLYLQLAPLRGSPK